jgi:hypothetical protein
LYGIIDMTDKKAASALRLSPHYYNTIEEVDAVVEALVEIIGACSGHHCRFPSADRRPLGRLRDAARGSRWMWWMLVHDVATSTRAV